MASVINTNISSLNAQRNLTTSQNSLATSLQRLSSGLRINSAKDDAAGLAISERFSTQIRGMNVAARNANDGISLAQSAEGAMTEISNNLQRIRELAVQSRNATNSDSDRAALNAEAQQLKAEVDRVAETTAFNGTKLLDGNFTNQAFQVGANQGETINISGIVNASSSALGSWTSVATPASVTGSAPVGVTSGGTTTAGAGALDVTGIAPTDGSNGYDAFDLTVGGVTVNVGAVAFDTDTATTEAALASAIAGAITGASINGLSATASGNNVTFANTDTSAVTIEDTDSVLGADVSVTAQATTGGTTSFGAIAAGELTINGQNIIVGTATTSSGRASDLMSAINALTTTTGVTASLTNGALTLSSATGDVEVGGTAAGTGTGLTAGTTSAVAGTAQTGFASLDISTADGADAAILAMDGALTALNSARADMGAIQNRFTSVVASLQTTSENLSASRSRILDTDFAAETANLTRGQILQQAGTAMLAQANSLPNGVLALLRG